MGSFSATITNVGSPLVTVTLANNVTYQQFLNSLGAYVYWFDIVYLYSTNAKQINEPVLYNYTDANGNSKVLTITPTKDPYQFSPALYINVKDFDIVIDGNSTVTFNLLPNTTLKFKLYGDVMSVNLLNGDKQNNFTELAETMGDSQFFADTDFPPDYAYE
jgi:hypothetical protein